MCLCVRVSVYLCVRVSACISHDASWYIRVHASCGRFVSRRLGVCLLLDFLLAFCVKFVTNSHGPKSNVCADALLLIYVVQARLPGRARPSTDSELEANQERRKVKVEKCNS